MSFYRPQRSWGKVVFSEGCVHILSTGGRRAWLLRGGMRGCSGGACMVALGGSCMGCSGGHAWLLRGGMHGCSGGDASLLWGGMHGWSGGGMRGCSGGACVGFDEIRSMSGRYTSYWNAFLLPPAIEVWGR